VRRPREKISVLVFILVVSERPVVVELRTTGAAILILMNSCARLSARFGNSEPVLHRQVVEPSDGNPPETRRAFPWSADVTPRCPGESITSSRADPDGPTRARGRVSGAGR